MASFVKSMSKGGLAVLWWSLLLLPGCGSQKSEKANEEQQFHRSLAGFVLPFDILWKFDIADVEGVPEDRQPTPQEYAGIEQATTDWYTTEIPLMYASSPGFTFREVDCDLEDTVYNPNADPNDTTQYVHEVLLNCEVIWDADTIEDTPDISKFLTDMNADFLLDSFVSEFLREADPQNPRNLFQFTQRIRYETGSKGTRGPEPATEETSPPVTTPGPGTEAPVAPGTTSPGTMAPVTTPPVPSPSPGPETTMPTTDFPVKKVAPPAKCGSLASTNGRGGAAADAKGCTSRRLDDVTGIRGRRKRKLKGSK